MLRKKRIVQVCIILVVFVSAGYFGTYYIRRWTADKSWIKDFGYQENEIYTMTFHNTCPEIPVSIGSIEYTLLFDTGCGSGLALTTELNDKISYKLLGEIEELNRDGSHRGWSKNVQIDEMAVFTQVFEDVQTSIADWRMFSSKKFNGIIGLEYFQSKVITLDYPGHRIAVSSNPIDTSKLDPEKYVILPLHKPTNQSQFFLPFFEAEYNGEPVMVYMDTGKNYSYINNPSCNISFNDSLSDRSQNYTDVSIKLGSREIMLKQIVQVNDLAQADGLPYPIMLEINSDQIWKSGLLVTFDLIDQRVIIRIR